MTKKTAQRKPSTRKKEVKKRQTKTSDKIQELKLDVEQEKDKYIRLFAEFENFKKRTAKERLDLFKPANQEVITALIPVLDDFDRANHQMEKEKGLLDQEGIKLIYNKFLEVLKTNGLAQTMVNIGDPFDAEIHEAISQIQVQKDTDKGKIIDIIETGYQLGDRIIRYPKVVVGQ